MGAKFSFEPIRRCFPAGRQAGSLRPPEADAPQKRLGLIQNLNFHPYTNHFRIKSSEFKHFETFYVRLIALLFYKIVCLNLIK